MDKRIRNYWESNDQQWKKIKSRFSSKIFHGRGSFRWVKRLIRFYIQFVKQFLDGPSTWSNFCFDSKLVNGFWHFFINPQKCFQLCNLHASIELQMTTKIEWSNSQITQVGIWTWDHQLEINRCPIFILNYFLITTKIFFQKEKKLRSIFR